MTEPRFRPFWRALFACALVLGLSLLASRLALAADDFVPFDEKNRARTNPNPFILAAYGFIWVAMLGYVAFLARGLSRARAELAELRRKLDAATGSRGR